jgi:hypothetical protein
MPPKNKGAEALSHLFNQASEGILSINTSHNGMTEGEKAEADLQVQYLNIQLLRPDPIQPRRILPERIHQDFHLQRLSAPQALKELITLAQVHARSAGRPFSNPFELLGVLSDDESSDLPTAILSVEEQLLRDLVQLAITLQNDGQVNPLTVVNLSQGVMLQYLIETGERRYWATWLLRDFHPSSSHDGKLPCVVIPTAKSSPFRQAKENTSRAGLNAIAMARQVALLLLHVHGYEMPYEAVGMDFYRQALNLDLRGKREHTTEVLAALGGISKQNLSSHKSLLRLSDEAIELADRHNLDIGKLWHVAMMESHHDQLELLHQIIQMNLTVKQIRELIEKGTDVSTNLQDGMETLPKSATQIAKFALKPDSDLDANKLARAVVGMERDKEVAKARIRSLKALLEETELYIDEL